MGVGREAWNSYRTSFFISIRLNLLSIWIPALHSNVTCFQEPDGSRNPKSPRNEFTDSRNFVRQLCDTSLLAANASQLRAVLDNGSENSYFIPLLVMIILSILCHVAFGILKIQRWKKEREAQMEHSKNSSLATTPQPQASTVNPKGVLCPCTPCMEVERYDEISMYVMFLVVISNVGIAGLGLSGPEKV